MHSTAVSAWFAGPSEHEAVLMRDKIADLLDVLAWKSEASIVTHGESNKHPVVLFDSVLTLFLAQKRAQMSRRVIDVCSLCLCLGDAGKAPVTQLSQVFAASECII